MKTANETVFILPFLFPPVYPLLGNGHRHRATKAPDFWPEDHQRELHGPRNIDEINRERSMEN